MHIAVPFVSPSSGLKTFLEIYSSLVLEMLVHLKITPEKLAYLKNLQWKVSILQGAFPNLYSILKPRS